MTKLDELQDDDRVLKDGQTITVRMHMMDGFQRLVSGDTASNAGHKPGALPVSLADHNSRTERYERRDQRVSDAWRTAPPLDPAQTVKTITPAASADVYERRDAKLRDAWMSA